MTDLLNTADKFYQDADYDARFKDVMNNTGAGGGAGAKVSAIAPADKTALWVDITVPAKPVLKVYVGTSWVAVLDSAE